MQLNYILVTLKFIDLIISNSKQFAIPITVLKIKYFIECIVKMVFLYTFGVISDVKMVYVRHVKNGNISYHTGK